MQTILDKLSTQPHKIFRVDAFGAMLTALLSGVILVKFQSFSGMPEKVLYALSFIACVYALYSFCCYFLKVNHWRFFLCIVILANTLYCLLIIGLIIYFYAALTPLGLIYFLLESGVICLLIFVEIRLLLKQSI